MANRPGPYALGRGRLDFIYTLQIFTVFIALNFSFFGMLHQAKHDEDEGSSPKESGAQLRKRLPLSKRLQG